MIIIIFIILFIINILFVHYSLFVYLSICSDNSVIPHKSRKSCPFYFCLHVPLPGNLMLRADLIDGMTGRVEIRVKCPTLPFFFSPFFFFFFLFSFATVSFGYWLVFRPTTT
jgi:hypothetical protein